MDCILGTDCCGLRSGLSRRVAAAAPFGSPTMSDWAHLHDIEAVKLGPGISEVSHTANEWVELAMVECAVGSYTRIARHFLS